MKMRGGTSEAQGFEVLVAPHVDELFAFLARSAGCEEDGHDLLQETLIRAWQGYRRYEERGKARGWLFTVARRTLIDWTRRRDPEPAAGTRLVEAWPDPEGDPHEQTVARRMQAAVVQAVAALPEERRTVFLMRHHTPMTFREIADTLGIPLGTALSHMHHVTRALRLALAPYGEDSVEPGQRGDADE